MEEMRNKADADKATDTNSLEEPPVENTNVTTTPPNTEDQKKDGINREVF